MNDSNQTMQGQVAIVTGATDGIGKVAARELAARGATVVIVGRNPMKTPDVVNAIRKKTGNSHVAGLLADLSVMQQVRSLADEFRAEYDRLDVLVNNAGGFFLQRRESAEGLEMSFALNHLAYFLLTYLLLDMLKASAPARIVNVSSGAHYRGALNFDDLQMESGYNGMQQYSNSKLMNVMFTYELARRLEGTRVTANVLHPGTVATKFGANNWGLLGRLGRKVANLFSISAQEGAELPVYLATSQQVANVSGRYFEHDKGERESSQQSYDRDAQRRLWQVSAEITGLDGNTAAQA